MNKFIIFRASSADSKRWNCRPASDDRTVESCWKLKFKSGFCVSNSKLKWRRIMYERSCSREEHAISQLQKAAVAVPSDTHALTAIKVLWLEIYIRPRETITFAWILFLFKTFPHRNLTWLLKFNPTKSFESCFMAQRKDPSHSLPSE